MKCQNDALPFEHFLMSLPQASAEAIFEISREIATANATVASRRRIEADNERVFERFHIGRRRRSQGMSRPAANPAAPARLSHRPVQAAHGRLLLVAGILPAQEFDRWCIEPHARIVEKVRAEIPGARIIAFPRGAGTAVRRFAPGPDSSTRPGWADGHGGADSGIREVQTDAW
jgi:hypothetical protein